MKWLVNQNPNNHLNDVGLFSVIYTSNGVPTYPDLAGVNHYDVYLNTFGDWVIV